MGRKPALPRPRQPAELLTCDHLERVTEAGSALGLHLAEHEPTAATHHEVELVAARPDVGTEHAEPAQPVVEPGTALGCAAPTPGRRPRARLRRRGSREPGTSVGGSRRARARAPRRNDRA